MRVSSALVPLVASLVLACGGPPPKTGEPRAAGTPPTDVPVARVAATPLDTTCTEPSPDPAAGPRERAVDALLRGEPLEARDLLEAAVRANPRDRAAEALRPAADKGVERKGREAAARVTSARRVTLAPIPLAHATPRPIALASAAARVHLEKASEKKNLIVDEADWEKNNALSRVRRWEGIPEHVPPRVDRVERRASYVHADHAVTPFGTQLVVTAPGRAPLVFDASAAMRGPRTFELGFAQVVGDVLVLELAYNGYAKDSGGKNGYLAAFDVATGALRWVTDPLVANASEALVTATSVVTGYGFTAEPDYLVVVDLATGDVVQKMPVKSGPSAVRLKGEELHVRTYDQDYVFRSTTGFPRAAEAGLSAVVTEPPPVVDTATRCWLRRATTAVATRDVAMLSESLRVLRERPFERALYETLEEQRATLAGERPGAIDLTTAPLVKAPAPPWEAFSANPAPSPPPKVPRLVKTASAASRGTDGSAHAGVFLAPMERGKNARVPAEIPTQYGMEDLRALIPAGGDTRLLVYGGRYLAVVRGRTTERVLDLDTLRHPPRADPTWKEFAEQDVTYAAEQGGVLYVCNGGGSYAKEVYGKKGFVTAIEPATGKILWRSAPLVCDANFAFAGDVLVTGYGFTAEPDYVYLLRRADGATVGRAPLDSAPSWIDVRGSRVHVETYNGSTDLELF